MKLSLIGIGTVAIVVAIFGGAASSGPAFAQAPAAGGIGNGNWKPLRPTQEHRGPDAGRINILAFDPVDNSTIYAGSPAGGLFRSQDNGRNWTSLSDTQSNLAITDIAIDPTSPRTIYILTGDGDGQFDPKGLAPFSSGILKSSDGGATWQKTILQWETNQSLSQLVIGHRLAIHPTQPQILLAATTRGLLRTTDGFTTFTPAKMADGSPFSATLNKPIFDVLFNPADPSVAYAATMTSVYRSLDAGATWTQLSGGLPNGAPSTRIRLAVSPASPDTLYVLYGAADGFSIGLYRSDNRGETFTLQSRSNPRPANNGTLSFDLSRPNILHQFNDFDGGQTGYTLAMTVSPTDINRVHVGALDTWRSDDGGKTWTQTSDWLAAMGTLGYVHADIHDLKYRGAHLFVASDGGVYRSDDAGATWHGLNNITFGGGIAQIYSICTTPQNPNLIYYGAQDNGSWKLELDGTLTKIYDGDGAVCQIDPNDSNTVYLSYIQGDLQFSNDGGSHLKPIRPAGGGQGAWITPYVLGVTDPDLVYACYADVWVSRRGNNWKNLSLGALGPSIQCAQIAIAQSDPQTIYVAKDATDYAWWSPSGGGNVPPFLGGGGVFRTTDGGASWQLVTATLPVASAAIAGLAVSPTDPRRVWVTFLGLDPGIKVYETNDGGATWNNIHAGLPNVAVHVVAALNSPAHGVFIGTDIGVYYRDDNSGSWIPFGNGMPKVIVTALAIDETRHRMFAGTYGRGIWLTDLPAP
jgi:photosystem II stability/assembly factor-like uncharacterized protein